MPKYGALFDEAVRLRLHGDASVGAYLSSGVDSSAIVDSMARQATGQVKAFTIRFDNKKLDESPEATRIANLCGIEHRLVNVSNQALAGNFRASLWHSEIPVFNTHGTAKYLLSAACQGHVKAILTGEGADETLAGYTAAYWLRLSEGDNRCSACFAMENKGGFPWQQLFNRERTFWAMTCLAQRARAKRRIRCGSFLPCR